jgi:hypothetical protein
MGKHPSITRLFRLLARARRLGALEEEEAGFTEALRERFLTVRRSRDGCRTVSHYVATAAFRRHVCAVANLWQICAYMDAYLLPYL